MLSASKLRPAQRRRLAAGLPLALFLALAGGCGGGGDDGPSEEALRGKLQKGFERTAAVDSARVSILFEINVDDEETSGCLDLSVDGAKRGGAAEAVVMSVKEGTCDDGAQGVQVVAIGRDVWVTREPGRFAPGRLDRGVLAELTARNTDFEKLAGAATDLSESVRSNGGGPTYRFSAPGSSFSQAEGADDTDVDFTAGFDKQGYLRELIGTIEAEGATAVVTIAYSEIEAVDRIEPPPRKYVEGSPVEIHSEDEFEALLEGPLEEEF